MTDEPELARDLDTLEHEDPPIDHAEDVNPNLVPPDLRSE